MANTVWVEKEVREEVNVLAHQMYNDPTNGEPVLELVEKDNKKTVVEVEEELPF